MFTRSRFAARARPSTVSRRSLSSVVTRWPSCWLWASSWAAVFDLVEEGCGGSAAGDVGLDAEAARETLAQQRDPVILGKRATGVASSGIVPQVTFTDPQICTAGRTERQARDEGLDVRAGTRPAT
jgi:hypothetical protein